MMKLGTYIQHVIEDVEFDDGLTTHHMIHPGRVDEVNEEARQTQQQALQNITHLCWLQQASCLVSSLKTVLYSRFCTLHSFMLSPCFHHAVNESISHAGYTFSVSLFVALMTLFIKIKRKTYEIHPTESMTLRVKYLKIIESHIPLHCFPFNICQ